MPEKKVAKLVVHLHRIPEAFVRTSPPPPIAKIQFHYSNNIAFLKHHSNAEKTRLAYYDHSYARQPNNNNASSCGHLCHGDDNLLPPAAIAFYGAAGESCTYYCIKMFPVCRSRVSASHAKREVEPSPTFFVSSSVGSVLRNSI